MLGPWVRFEPFCFFRWTVGKFDTTVLFEHFLFGPTAVVYNILGSQRQVAEKNHKTKQWEYVRDQRLAPKGRREYFGSGTKGLLPLAGHNSKSSVTVTRRQREIVWF